jgi:DNA-binding transcriptional LysR family regulator
MRNRRAQAEGGVIQIGSSPGCGSRTRSGAGQGAAEGRVRVQIDSVEVLGRGLRQRALDFIVGESSILESDESIDVFEPLEPVESYLFVRSGHPLASTNVSLRDVLDYPLIQVARPTPRVFKPILNALSASSKDAQSRPIPAIECPTIPLAVDTVIGSDAVMLASLGEVKRELAQRRVVPVFHDSWLRTNWAFMKLRHRSLSPAAIAFVAALRAAHRASVAEDAKLEKRWHALLPPRGVPSIVASSKRRRPLTR